jgi:hypothetical protein
MCCNFVFEPMRSPMDEIEYKRNKMTFYAVTAVTTKVLKRFVHVMPCSLTDLRRVPRGTCHLYFHVFPCPEDGGNISSENAVNRSRTVTFCGLVLFTQKNKTCDCIYSKSLENVDSVATGLLSARFWVRIRLGKRKFFLP